MWPLYEHENLHIEKKRIFILTSEYYEANVCEHNLKLLLSRTNCAFQILPEMGAERKISELDTSTWPQEHGGQDFQSDSFVQPPSIPLRWIHGTSVIKVYCPSHQYANLPSLCKNRERTTRTEVLENQVPWFCLVSGQHVEDGLCWDTLLQSPYSGRMIQCLDNLSRNFHWHRSTNKHHTISDLGISKSQITELSKWLPGYIMFIVQLLNILYNHVWDTCCDVSNLLLEQILFWHISIWMAQISNVKNDIIVVDILDKCIRSIHWIQASKFAMLQRVSCTFMKLYNNYILQEPWTATRSAVKRC